MWQLCVTTDQLVYLTGGNTSLLTLLLGNAEPSIRLKYSHDIVLMACILGVGSLTTPNPGSRFSDIRHMFLIWLLVLIYSMLVFLCSKQPHNVAE